MLPLFSRSFFFARQTASLPKQRPIHLKHSIENIGHSVGELSRLVKPNCLHPKRGERCKATQDAHRDPEMNLGGPVEHSSPGGILRIREQSSPPHSQPRVPMGNTSDEDLRAAPIPITQHTADFTPDKDPQRRHLNIPRINFDNRSGFVDRTVRHPFLPMNADILHTEPRVRQNFKSTRWNTFLPHTLHTPRRDQDHR